ncbi:hypothetical protein CC1G_07378 [Coprinopsis cinerea okayama7|uniref:Chitin-binding type-3 domain-containing protein n=1 Tax=Coprinopsis cinerea (strain Okayama-7 / 130 / ATCC MYA-4618 / FGSC 9003) TaxID=240176 RepID=A8N6K7_COPC7|nr:hypothetical protein CC1G_07378 [Coprinopsis cinerea okayama7\|eukprot:XP_001830463.1 hypothetical protein CC1G_07378 [Coprinopsis cinerea okayama7\
MTRGWEPGTQYNHGDVVSYNGSNYKIIQPHRSQGDWTPDVTPALWGKIPGGGHGQQQGHCPPPQQSHGHQNQAPPAYQAPQNQQPLNNDNKTQGQGPEPQKSGNDSDSDGEGGKKWYKDSKKLLGLAGGLVGGAALVGGAVAAYKHYDKKKDQKEWLEDAQARTMAVRSGQSSDPVNWVLGDGKNIPFNAIPGGKENNSVLYISRGFHKGSTTPGKASAALKTGAVIGYAHDEVDLAQYEILVGDSRAVRWIPAAGKLNIQALGARPVQGGVDTDGTPLFVVRANIKGGVHPGKASEKLKGAFIPYGGGEEEVQNYEVLCFA